MKALKRFLNKLRLRGALATTGPLPIPEPAAPTQEAIKVTRKAMPAAKQAFPWTEDIEAHNHAIWDRVRAEKLRQFKAWDTGEEPAPPVWPKLAEPYLKEHEPDVARRLALWDCVEAWDWQRSRNVVITKDDGPLQPLLTPDERVQAAEAGRLSRDVDYLETQALEVPKRPTWAEMLEASGGNEQRAKQLREKVEAIFGPCEHEWVDEAEDGEVQVCLECGERESARPEESRPMKRAILDDKPPTPAQEAFDRALATIHDGGDGYLYDKAGKRVGIIDEW